MSSKPKHVRLREKRNQPPKNQPWVWVSREMLESDAWRTMPINTRRFVERLMLEQMAHAGKENGKLPCTYNDCIAWGIPRELVGRSQKDAVTRGLVYLAERGNASPRQGRRPNVWGLGWLPGYDGSTAPDKWRGFALPPIYIDSSTGSRTILNGHKQPKTKTGEGNKVREAVPLRDIKVREAPKK